LRIKGKSAVRAICQPRENARKPAAQELASTQIVQEKRFLGECNDLHIPLIRTPLAGRISSFSFYPYQFTVQWSKPLPAWHLRVIKRQSFLVYTGATVERILGDPEVDVFQHVPPIACLEVTNDFFCIAVIYMQ
jgi:hypothetical protein